MSDFSEAPGGRLLLSSFSRRPLSLDTILRLAIIVIQLILSQEDKGPKDFIFLILYNHCYLP